MGERTHEMSLLKPDPPRVMKSYLIQPFGQEEWESLEQSFLIQNGEGPSPVERLASLHLVGEFVVAHIMQSWVVAALCSMPCRPTIPMLPTAGNRFGTRYLMSTNTMQFSAMHLLKTKASRAVLSQFSEIATYARSMFKKIEGVNITFIGGSQHRFTIPESWLRCCVLQRNASVVMYERRS